MFIFAKKPYFLRRTAICLLLAGMCFNGAYGQSKKTPKGRAENFYRWSLKSINNGKEEPSKTVMNSHLSKRFSRWYYSEAGQNLGYDAFVNGQDRNECWAGHIVIGEPTIDGSKATLGIIPGSPAGDWNMPLTISLVKEVGTWKIDRVKGP